MILDTYFARSIKATDIDELSWCFVEAVTALGFEYCAFLIFPPQKLGQRARPFAPIMTFPPHLAAHYISQEVYEIDEYLARTRAEGRPLFWQETIYKADPGRLHSKYADFIKMMSDGGHNALTTIPLYGSANVFGITVLQHKNKTTAPDDHKLALARSISDDLMHQYMRLTTKREQTEEPELSIREKEVLLWVVKGKSNAVIAEIMGLSPHTIDTYIRRCCKKTGTSNRTEAAIRAILSGAIHY